ncbi:hypothetical protein [Aurantiacibacter marinus]|uniref:Major facilitator superfamily (MFS) profile domain-containing protein n=1 Tax=Aurantiacibacter marinus TaxID=874156 RepID=A0A0H0XV94_9SPHN|nr:hypothetical protein [Aurantiacibacter marinus]KLI64235.1 hypothetical protein AAV99_00810 [Aurantiacibacter marinus]
MTDTEFEATEKKRKLKKTLFALILGGVAGFLGAMGLMELIDTGLLGDLGASREVAALVALVYLLTAGAIGIGLVNPKAGARFLNVEDAEELDEQRGMLMFSTIGMAVAGLALLIVALSGQGGVIGPVVALVSYVVLSVVAVFTSLKSIKFQDELMQAVGKEAGSTSFYLVVLVGGTWALLAHLGFVTGPAPLDWLTMFWALMLLAAFIVTGRRGMLAMR